MLVDLYRKDVSSLSSDKYKFPNQYFKNTPKSSEHVGVNEQPSTLTSNILKISEHEGAELFDSPLVAGWAREAYS